MKIVLIFDQGELGDRGLSTVEKILSRFKLNYEIYKFDGELEDILASLSLKEDTFLLLVGGDRLLLRTMLSIGDRYISVVPLAGKKSSGFFTVRGIEELHLIIMDLIRGKYRIRRLHRLVAWDGERALPPAFNDIVVLNSTPGKLIRYGLYINGDYIWSDTSDGIIVSTPVGSTGYSLSAGGPILKDLDAVSIVPINSLIPSHKPIVTSMESTIQLVDLSPKEYVVVVDGQYRHWIETEKLRISKSRYTIGMIEFYEGSTDLDTKLSMRIPRKGAKVDLKDLPPSAKFVFRILEYEGGLTLRELMSKTLLPPRTVRHALKILIEHGLVERGVLDKDARISIYRIKRGG